MHNHSYSSAKSYALNLRWNTMLKRQEDIEPQRNFRPICVILGLKE